MNERPIGKTAGPAEKRPDTIDASDIDLCRSGDQRAFQRIYDATHGPIFRLMVRMVNVQEAPDLTQQTYLKAYRSLDRFRGQSKFETWLYRIAVNEALQFLRRRGKRPTAQLSVDPADGRPRGSRIEEAELLDVALQRLDSSLRTLFLLRELQGLSYADLAETLDLNEGTIGSRLNRARRELRRHLVELGWEG